MAAQNKRVERRTRVAAMSHTSEADETRVCKECRGSYASSMFRPMPYISRAGTQNPSNQCRPCYNKSRRVVRGLRKNEGNPPKHCEICSRAGAMHCDHDHTTGEFRGWLCSSCNKGLGFLGDDAEGLRRALAYLERVQAP